MVWQLIAVQPDGRSTVYLRSRLPDASAANRFDPANALRWEIPVALAPPQKGTKWVWAKQMRLVRGTEGESLWLRQQKEEELMKTGGRSVDAQGFVSSTDKDKEEL